MLVRRRRLPIVLLRKICEMVSEQTKVGQEEIEKLRARGDA